MTDKEGYPTEEELEKIENWKYEDGYIDLMSFIKELWYYPFAFKKRKNMYTLVTLGWSGNESVIHSLHKNHIFWIVCWVSSNRGGAHVFEVKEFVKATQLSLF